MLAVSGRPSSWEPLLFFHVLAALILLGGMVTVTLASMLAPRRPRAGEFALLKRVAYRTSLFVVLPGFVLLVVFGELLRAEEDAGGAWLDVAYPVTYLGLLAGGGLAWLSRRGALQAERLAQGSGIGELRSLLATRAANVLAPLVLAALVAVLWLMAAKPA